MMTMMSSSIVTKQFGNYTTTDDDNDARPLVTV